MLQKIQYIMMVLPIVAATWLCFSANPPQAIPAEHVVDYDLLAALQEQANQAGIIQVAQAEDLQSSGIEE
jgi:hypothetical protein